jgi:hypothetical protein
MTPTRTTEQAYMIIDVKGDSSIRDAVLDSVIKTTQENMKRLTVNRGIPPATLPENAERFELVNPLGNGQLGGLAALAQSQGANLNVPQCKNPILTMKSDSSVSGWSEKTTFFICVVQYQKGYHVDVYTTFEQQSGGLSVSALSQTVARSLVGDTSQHIPRTMKRLEDAMKAISSEATVIDSYIPSKWQGFFVDETTAVSAP